MSYQILVIEDDPDFRAVLMKAFIDYFPELTDIQCVATGEEAIAALAKKKEDSTQPYSLIVSDVCLPGKISGLDLWRYCLERWPMTPYLMLSGMGYVQFLREIGYSRTTPSFLSKPAPLDAFLTVAEKLLTRQR